MVAVCTGDYTLAPIKNEIKNEQLRGYGKVDAKEHFS